jgi:hypothetical protein
VVPRQFATPAYPEPQAPLSPQLADPSPAARSHGTLWCSNHRN